MKNVAVVEDTDSSSSENEGLWSATTPIAVAVAVAIPSTPPLETSISPQSDEEAQASVVAAREQGIANIRHHCEQHLSQNPDSSYVTWIATLHPENAQVSIDPRFLINGNPWLSVYGEAKEDLQKGRGCVTPSAPPPPSPFRQDDAGGGHEAGTGGTKKCGGGGVLDFIIGSALVLASVAASFSIELVASYCYLSYWLCSKIVDICSPPNMFTWLPLFIAFILGKVFQLLDAVLLFVSIILVESIAGANYVLCTILACSHDQGKTMHQMTRKLPHVVRWAFHQTLRSGNRQE
mmetsp:Transcript_37026/g.66640  ORF Transcript_37026/g.66640 Transcript_37026/m.66640 type:complete len:292 (+) Transcript_37026:99-974(+)|eukprot:CAMPEP_0201883314 /NCGR_PEP_ID=MMETSP0902-20130614/15388_1 /ASSEMBLY_ACC=CAM_ASM_000551 /TAXON_ID=420261 /ORGANISM="Thalassiosira antarctica, Strain CCMP982" /LENGTH=291 /DNA_ID=CAMNT_0048412071 /DNA_START=46 /DNA_END=921 /DNA_ORIENTATION=-